MRELNGAEKSEVMSVNVHQPNTHTHTHIAHMHVYKLGGDSGWKPYTGTLTKNTHTSMPGFL